MMRAMPAPRIIRACAMIAAAAALAACASDSATTAATAPAAQPAAMTTPAQPAPAEPPAPPPTTRAPATPATAQPGGRTIQQERAHCWMTLESDRKAPRELEKRAAMVEKCAEERMRGM
jgi:hypothetical protein